MAFDVFLLAAGMGSRMGELTKSTPKPLVNCAGKPLIDYNLELIARSGVKRVIINTHYLADKLAKHLGDGSRFGFEVVLVRETELLGTGGGIKNIRGLLKEEHLLTLNSDSLFGAGFSLPDVFHEHKSSNAEVTMVLRPAAEGFTAIGVDEAGKITGFGSGNHMYCGVQVINRKMLAELPEDLDKFCIARDFHVHQISKGSYYHAFIYKGVWFDVGTPERLKEAESAFSS